MNSNIVLTMSLIIAPSIAMASVPECALHLQEPPVGGVLTPQQFDANNACKIAVEQASSVADSIAHIRASEKKQQGNDTHPSTSSGLSLRASAPSALPGVISSPDAPHGKPEPAITLPSVDAVSLDAGKAVAYLRYPQGGTVEATRGTQLRDGSTIVFISTQGVFIKEGNKLQQLPTTGDASPEADSTAATILPSHTLTP